MKTDDRRIRRTKKALREALAELMMKKELRSITIQELSDTADVHRATFYVHYKDIYDLYEQLEDSVVHEISEIIVGDPTHEYVQAFRKLIDYVIDNYKTFRMFLHTSIFQERISQLLEEKYLEIWQYETGQNEITEEWHFLTRYHMEGILSIISRWVENDYSYPKNKLIDIILKVDANFDQIME